MSQPGSVKLPETIPTFVTDALEKLVKIFWWTPPTLMTTQTLDIMKIKCKTCNQKMQVNGGKVDCQKPNCSINYPGTMQTLDFDQFDVDPVVIIEQLELEQSADDWTKDGTHFPYCGY